MDGRSERLGLLHRLEIEGAVGLVRPYLEARRLLYAATGSALAAALLATGVVEPWPGLGFCAPLFASLGYVVGRKEDRLRALMITDPLTGLPNRRYFEQRSAEELRRAERAGAPMAVLLIDVDGLQGINDQHGREAGDRALRAVGASLRSQLRANDLAARFGGDEFAVLLPDTTAAAAGHIAERIRARVAEHHRTLAHLTVSVGIADRASTRPSGCLDVILAADRSLFRAKAQAV